MSSKKYTVFSWIWLLIISVFTVLKIAPDGLNADILMNSVMSLQNVTLYYWGQNRLLNILPFAVAFIKNPTLNLVSILIITSLSFYGLLYVLSYVAAILLRVKSRNLITFEVFLLTSTFFLLLFSPGAISEVTIGHIEYSLPALLLVFSVLKFSSEEFILKNWKKFFFPILALILAIGINPSILIPAVAISFAILFYVKRVRRGEVLLIFLSLISFLAWNFISKKHGNLSYNEFKIETLYIGLPKVLVGLIDILNLASVFFVICVFSFYRIFLILFVAKREIIFKPIISYVFNVVMIFSVCWLALFASSRWVEINAFAWRYFIFVIFSLIFIFSIYAVDFFDKLNAGKFKVITTLVLLFSLTIVGFPISKINFNDYKIFQRVNSLTEPGGHLYSGDYWVVWPSVLRDIIKGYEAFGLTYRGDANRISARNFIIKEIDKNGYAKIYCLNDTVDNCMAQANGVVSYLYAISSNQLKDGVYLIKVSAGFSSLDFSADNLASLPTQVGVVDGKSIATKLKSGYLIYGPYTHIKSGKYYLSVIGQAKRLDSAYAEVVSNKGNKVHARVDLSKSKSSFLIERFEVDLPTSVDDLEVRIWVGEGDEITLHGYTLKSD